MAAISTLRTLEQPGDAAAAPLLGEGILALCGVGGSPAALMPDVGQCRALCGVGGSTPPFVSSEIGCAGRRSAEA